VPDEVRYSEGEFRERLIVKKERIDAAMATAMLLHEELRDTFLNDLQPQRLPDGRIALDPQAFNRILSELGRVTSHRYLETVLRAVFSEDA